MKIKQHQEIKKILVHTLDTGCQKILIHTFGKV